MSIKLRELLKDSYTGKLVLPDFQRSFVWEPEDVRELLVPVFAGNLRTHLIPREAQIHC